MCLNFGIPKLINFPFGTNGKSIILGVPILEHIKVYIFTVLTIFSSPGRSPGRAIIVLPPASALASALAAASALAKSLALKSFM